MTVGARNYVSRVDINFADQDGVLQFLLHPEPHPTDLSTALKNNS